MNLATPISHLFDDKDAAQKIIANSDCLECRDYTIDYDYTNQQVFHTDLQPIHKWGSKELSYLCKIKKNKPELKLISFHLASSFSNPTLENHKFIPGGRKLLPAELKTNAQVNLQKTKSILGSNVLLAVENNNDLGTEAYDYISDPEFIKSIVYDNNIWFLYDISHAKISSFYRKIPFVDYNNNLPLDRIIQIHISKCGFNDFNEMTDTHELPGDDEISEVKLLLEKYKSVEYLTVEYYRNVDNLLVLLKSARKNLLNG